MDPRARTRAWMIIQALGCLLASAAWAGAAGGRFTQPSYRWSWRYDPVRVYTSLEEKNARVGGRIGLRSTGDEVAGYFAARPVASVLEQIPCVDDREMEEWVYFEGMSVEIRRVPSDLGTLVARIAITDPSLRLGVLPPPGTNCKQLETWDAITLRCPEGRREFALVLPIRGVNGWAWVAVEHDVIVEVGIVRGRSPLPVR